MDNRAKASLAVLAALVIIVAAVMLSGAKPTRIGSREITVRLLGAVPFNTANSLSVAYSSIGVHYTTSNGSAWSYYNTTQALTFTGPSDYTVAQLYVPDNSTADGLELSVASSNVSIGGAPYNAVFQSSRIYVPVSSTRSSSSETILVNVTTLVAPVADGATLLFAVKPYASAEPYNGTGNASISAYSSNALSVTGAEVTSAGNATSIRITLEDNSPDPVKISSVILSGNLLVTGNVSTAAVISGIMSSLLNSSSLSSILPSSAAQGLGSQISGAIANNSGLFSSIENSLPANIRGIISGFNLSDISESTGGAVSSATQYLSQLNSSAYRSILEQALSADKSFNSSYLSNSNIQGLESMVSNLGGLKNSSIYNSIVSSAIGGEYDAYMAKAANTLAAEASIGAVAFAVSSNGVMTQLTHQAQLGSTSYGIVIGPYNSTIIAFIGKLSAGPQGAAMETSPGNTYKIIVLGNNSAATYAVASR